MRHRLLIAAFMSVGFSTPISAQESDSVPVETSGDVFGDAVSDYIESEVKKKLRADAVKKALEKVGNKTLKSLADKLKITRFRPKDPRITAFMLASKIAPLNEGEEESLRKVLEDYWPYPKPQKKPDYVIIPEIPGSTPPPPLDPGERDIRKIIDYVLVLGGCRATESEIYSEINLRFDYWTANQAIRSWTEDETFSQNYTSHLEGNTVVYTMTGGSCASTQVAPPQPKLSKAAQYLIDEAISYACEGRGGNMASRNIFVQDLDGDGREDLILDHAGITCSSGRPISCGAQVCATDLFMRRGELLKKELDLLGTVTSISTDPVPTITFYMHGGGTPSLRWNGRSFDMR